MVSGVLWWSMIPLTLICLSKFICFAYVQTAEIDISLPGMTWMTVRLIHKLRRTHCSYYVVQNPLSSLSRTGKWCFFHPDSETDQFIGITQLHLYWLRLESLLNLMPLWSTVWDAMLATSPLPSLSLPSPPTSATASVLCLFLAIPIMCSRSITTLWSVPIRH